MEDLVIASVAENRARETCVAVMATSTGATLTVFSTVDDHRYSTTLDTLRAIEPDEILISESCRERILTRKICKALCEDVRHARVAYVSRELFDQDRGAAMLQRVLTEGTVDEDVLSRYIVLAASHCLLKYIEKQSGEHFAASSVRFQLDPASFESEHLVIDRRSALALEIVQNSRTGEQTSSLFGKLNRTKTSVGAQKLRASLLCPSSDIATIEARQDVVQDIVENEELLQILLEELPKFPNLDRIVNGLCRIPSNVTMKAAETAISTLLGLNQTLQLLPLLVSQLRARSPTSILLQTIIGTMENEDLEVIQRSLAELLSPTSTYRRKADEQLDAACFSIKPGYNGMLDVARKALLQSVEDIHSAAEALSAEHELVITVKFAAGKGFHLVVPVENANATLPGVFIRQKRNRKSVTCTTTAIESLSCRVHESTQEVLLLTYALLQEFMETVRQDMDALFAVIDAIALLDMLMSFADLAITESAPYSRPQFTEQGPLVIKAGQHPIANAHCLSPFVPTDVLTSPFMNFQIVTGPNGSGKTTLVKQIAVIVLMAQAGAWVPAEHCIVPVRDRILTRMGSSDDMENSISSFHMEMRDTAYVLQNLTDRSLVLIDELGRSTSHFEGLAIAWAVSEALVGASAYSFFITHYHQLTHISKLYANAKNIHLETELSERTKDGDPDANVFAIDYLRTVVEGPSAIESGYGLALAEKCGIPPAVVDKARTIRGQLSQSVAFTADSVCEKTGSVAYEKLYWLAQRLALMKDSTLPDSGLRSYLDEVRRGITDEEEGNYRRIIESEREIVK